MSSPLTSTGPQRKLLGARKRCSNGSVHDQEVSQPSKYFRESSVDRLSKDERKTSKPPASNANHGKEEGCQWFENAFCSTRNISKRIILQESSCTKNLITEKENQENIVERLEVHTANKKLQSPRTKKEDEDSNSQKDVFEESFQDLDFLSHVESIESQNSVDFADTVAESPAENLVVVNRPEDNTQLTVASGKTESHRAVEKTFGGKQSSDLEKNVEIASNTLKFEKQSDSDRCEGKDVVDTHVSDVLGRTPQTGKEEGLVSIRVGSLRDRLKRKLLQNVGARSPVSPAQTVEEGRQSRIKEVEREAAILQDEGSADDIGPFYGLPSKVQDLLQKQRGITSLYEWQDRCLKLPSLQKGGNLVYSLPTSGGKTLVAEVLILKELLCKKRDALMILPFVSIVQEKVKGLAQLAVELDFLVEEYAGSRGRFPPIKHRRRCLYIATIEKAHSLVNSLLEQDRLDSLGLVVVDELHMIGEGRSRGACLEATLLKVLHARASTQIIGMSATLNNIGDLLSFLKADIFSSDFRPVKLTEYVKLQDNIFEVQKGVTLQDSLDHQRTVTFESRDGKGRP